MWSMRGGAGVEYAGRGGCGVCWAGRGTFPPKEWKYTAGGSSSAASITSSMSPCTSPDNNGACPPARPRTIMGACPPARPRTIIGAYPPARPRTIMGACPLRLPVTSHLLNRSISLGLTAPWYMVSWLVSRAYRPMVSPYRPNDRPYRRGLPPQWYMVSWPQGKHGKHGLPGPCNRARCTRAPQLLPGPELLPVFNALKTPGPVQPVHLNCFSIAARNSLDLHLHQGCLF